MATVALTQDPDLTTFGNKKVSVAEVTLDSSYPTGGEVVTPAQLGLRKVDFAVTTIKAATGAGVNVANAYYDKDTGKVLAYDETPAQVANGADIATTVVQVVAFGSV